jgi:hypothetical protein
MRFNFLELVILPQLLKFSKTLKHGCLPTFSRGINILSGARTYFLSKNNNNILFFSKKVRKQTIFWPAVAGKGDMSHPYPLQML